MFDKGMPFHGIKQLTVVFNSHETDYVAEFPRAKKGTYYNNGSKIVKAAAKPDTTAAAKPANATAEATYDETDDELTDTAAQ